MKDYHLGHSGHLTWNTANGYAASIMKWAKEYNVDPDWMTAIYTHESHWDTKATDDLDSWGIPQIQVSTAQIVADELKLDETITAQRLTADPDIAIRLSCRHYRDLLDEFNGDCIQATRAYNRGDKGVKNTRLPGLDYFQDVFNQYWNFEKFKGEKDDPSNH